jgi:hypothetical protein
LLTEDRGAAIASSRRSLDPPRTTGAAFVGFRADRDRRGSLALRAVDHAVEVDDDRGLVADGLVR